MARLRRDYLIASCAARAALTLQARPAMLHSTALVGACGELRYLASVPQTFACDDFIVVAPQLPHAGDDWHRYSATVDSIVAEVMCDLPGDTQRVYLTGFSFGGNGVFDLAAAVPDRWAALWAVDPTRPPCRAIEHPIWLSVGEATRLRRSKFVEPMHLADVTELADEDILMHGDRFFADLGLDHVGSAAQAYGDERIYRWLLSKSRSAATVDSDGAERGLRRTRD